MGEVGLDPADLRAVRNVVGAQNAFMTFAFLLQGSLSLLI